MKDIFLLQMDLHNIHLYDESEVAVRQTKHKMLMCADLEKAFGDVG